MQRWEYLHARIEFAHGDWKAHFVNGQEIQQWDVKPDTAMFPFIAQMGELGWELIFYLPYWGTAYAMVKQIDLTIEAFQLIFKRPKVEERAQLWPAPTAEPSL